ncbi:hypothetical protein Vadar_025221 [Vaccinium darrowii]|uniref:Uncharacterized protein n=1 Tax=Vaccinium darrowii TaxID=229202 RepID=A0ACB7Z733_9ERIC|nr:hypothetical protein Vadar_025221 [Vaccinium darrowii]
MSNLEIDDENEFDMDDLMDKAAKFDLPENTDLEMENDDEVAEKTENESKKGGDGLVKEEMDEDNDLEYCDFSVDGGMIEEGEGERGRGKGRRKGNVGPPTPTDWDKVKLYVSFLKVFYVATLKFSGSLYVTCNAFFDEMVLIQQAIKKLCATNDSVLNPLARENNLMSWRNWIRLSWNQVARLRSKGLLFLRGCCSGLKCHASEDIEPDIDFCY